MNSSLFLRAREVPEDVFRQYDELRCSLADEVLVSIKDVMAVTEVEAIVKRIKPTDTNLLRLIDQKGPTYSKAIVEELGREGKEAIVRLKARGLIVPRRESEHYYRYDMTDLGLSVLEVLNQEKTEIPNFPTK